MQLPAALKVTKPAEIEHTLDDPAEIVIATVSPELAVPEGVYVSPFLGEVGDVDVLVID